MSAEATTSSQAGPHQAQGFGGLQGPPRKVLPLSKIKPRPQACQQSRRRHPGTHLQGKTPANLQGADKLMQWRGSPECQAWLTDVCAWRRVVACALRHKVDLMRKATARGCSPGAPRTAKLSSLAPAVRKSQVLLFRRGLSRRPGMLRSEACLSTPPLFPHPPLRQAKGQGLQHSASSPPKQPDKRAEFAQQQRVPVNLEG